MKSRRTRGSAVGMVEYSMVISLVAVAVIVILALVGTGVVNVFQQAINGLTGGSSQPSALVVNITNDYLTTPGDLAPGHASVTITGSGGFNQTISSSQSFPSAPAGAYNITAQPFVGTPSQSGVATTLYPSIDNPGISLPSTNHTVTVDYSNAIPATSHRVTGADLALVTSATETGEGQIKDETEPDEDDSTASYTIVFSATPSWGTIQVGDVLAFDPGTYTPASLLVKVTSTANGGLTVNADEASLNDLFTRLSIDPATGTTSTFSSPAFTYPLIGPAGVGAPHGSSFGFGCGGSNIPPFNMTYSGNGASFNLVPTFNIAPPWQDQSGDQLGLTANITTDIHLGIDTAGATSLFCNDSFRVFTYFFPLIPVGFIGPIPIWVDPTLNLNMVLSANVNPINGHPWLTLNGVGGGSIGFLCDHTGCHGHNTVNLSASSVNFSGVGTAEVKIGPRIDFKVEGLVGPYVNSYIYGAYTKVPNINGTPNQLSVNGLVNGCYNGEIGIGFTGGMAFGPPGPFKSLWSWQWVERQYPFACIFPPMTPAAPSRSATINPDGCANPTCTSTDGYGTVGDSTGPGQIQFNPDNSQPRWTREGSVTTTIQFPSTLAHSGNYPGSCVDGTNPSNCPFYLAVLGRTDFNYNGAQLGAFSVVDGNGWVYTPTDAATCSGPNTGLHPCDDVILWGSNGAYGVGPGEPDGIGCGGNECNDGANIGANCKTATGVNDTCAGHTLIVTIYYESNGKQYYDYNGGSTNYPTQPESWLDGANVSLPYYPTSGNIVVSAPASAWTCGPSNLPAPVFPASAC